MQTDMLTNNTTIKFANRAQRRYIELFESVASERKFQIPPIYAPVMRTIHLDGIDWHIPVSDIKLKTN